MRLVWYWVQKAFRFPCQARTVLLADAIDRSCQALGKRQAATESLKEYINERNFVPRTDQ